MNPDDYLKLLQEAVASEYGVRLCLQGWTPAHRLRRRLYAARDRARARGDRSFDHLSVILDVSGAVLIVRRDQLPECTDPDDGLGAHGAPLNGDELPKRVFARGPRRSRNPISLDSGVPGHCHRVICDFAKRTWAGEFDGIFDRLVEVAEAKRSASTEPQLSRADVERVATRIALQRG